MRKLGYEPPPAIMPATIDQINKEREERKGQLEDQKTQLISELRSFKVTPSYDIYAEGTVLLGLFFGKKGNAFSKRFEDGRFLEETKGMGLEERTNYFKEALTRLNNDMRTATRQGYSETEIQKMSELMAWMMDPDPDHRPTSEQVFNRLMDLNGISAQEEENIRAGQKYRSEHPYSSEIDATEVDTTKMEAAKAKLEAARQKMKEAAANPQFQSELSQEEHSKL